MGYGLLFYSLIGINFLFFSSCQSDGEKIDYDKEIVQFKSGKKEKAILPIYNNTKIVGLPLIDVRFSDKDLYQMADTLYFMNITQAKYDKLYEKFHRLHPEDWLKCKEYYIEISMQDKLLKGTITDEEYQYYLDNSQESMLYYYKMVIERSGTSFLKADKEIKKVAWEEFKKI